MTEIKIKIEGMSCMHCVANVKKALLDLPGVSEVNVDIGNATVKYEEKKLTKEDIETAVKKAGYKVSSIS